MKRLIKKSDIYDGFKYDNKYFECFKNPSASEIREVKRTDKYGSIRGVILDNKDVYVWSGNILHEHINGLMSEKIDISEFRFAYNPSDGWIIDAHNSYDYNGITDLILEYENILYDIGDIEKTFDLFFCVGGDMLSSDEVTIEQIKEDKLRKDNEKETDNQDVEDVEDDTNDYDIADDIDVDDFDVEEDYIKEKQYAHKNIKRLIKKSEIYDNLGYFDASDNPWECFKNPTANEINIVLKSDPHHSIRGVILDSGEVYIWPGEVLHRYINRTLRSMRINVDQFRFAYESTRWIIDCNANYDFDEITDLIIKYESILSQIGDVNNIIFDLYNCYDCGQNDLIFLNEIKEYKKDPNFFNKKDNLQPVNV